MVQRKEIILGRKIINAASTAWTEVTKTAPAATSFATRASSSISLVAKSTYDSIAVFTSSANSTRVIVIVRYIQSAWLILSTKPKQTASTASAMCTRM